MIPKSTVFVVGAGASIPYGFPSGAQLLSEARKLSPEILVGVVGGAIIKSAARQFIELVRDSQSESLDALLEHRPDHQEVGKLFIAASIMRCEAVAANNPEPAGDWLRYLLSRMIEGCGSAAEFAAKNSVTFVTFNYDRMIERKIHLALRTQFTATDEACAEVLKVIPVHHLHGSIGAYLSSTGFVPFGGKVGRTGNADEDEGMEEYGRMYGATRAAGSIKIVHQADPKTAEFKHARAALTAAERVYFLGFGFAPTNVERLGFDNIANGAVVCATTYRMTTAEFREYALTPLKAAGHHKFSNPRNALWDCRDLLSETVNFLRN